MSPEENIEESIRHLRRQSPPHLDEQILDEAFDALEEAVGTKGRGGFRITMATAVAVGIAAVVLIGAAVFIAEFGKPKEAVEQRPMWREAAVEETKDVKPVMEHKAEVKRAPEAFDAELKEVEALFSARDIDGLIKALSGASRQNRLAAVIYLAKLGDAGTIKKLENLSERYGREKKDNLYAIATAAIQSRLEQEQAVVKEREGSGEDLAAKAERRQGYVNGWLVDTNDDSVKGRIWFAGKNVITDEAGEFKVPIGTLLKENDISAVSSFVLAHNWERDLCSVFVRGESRDFNDLELVLRPAASVSGYVVDRYENPVNDFDLVIYGSVDNKNLSSIWSVWLYDSDERLGGQIKIDDDGSFSINTIPTEINFWLAVQKPGFKTLVELSALQPGKQLKLGEVVLEPLEGFDEQTQWNCTLWGVVFDEANEPIPQAKLFARAGEEKFETVAGANGRYEFERLPNDVQIKLEVYSDRHGDRVFSHTCLDVSDRLDIQVFPPAYDWYGKEAPGIYVDKWLNTEPITLDELRGEVVLFCIGWDSVYQPDIIDEVKEIYEGYKDEPVTVITIHKRPWQGQPDEATLIKFIEEKGIEFPFAIDGDVDEVKDIILPRQRYRFADKIGLRPGYYGIGFSPGAMYCLYEVSARLRYYVIDKNGILRASPEFENVDKWIERLLGE